MSIDYVAICQDLIFPFYLSAHIHVSLFRIFCSFYYMYNLNAAPKGWTTV